MNRFTKILLVLIGLLGLVYLGGLQYFNSGGLEPDNTVWQSYIGRDTTVGILPDEYANYYTYTLVRTNKDMGFKIQGKFPDTRYFSFNVYSLEDYATQGSLVDYQIETDSGKPLHIVTLNANRNDELEIHRQKCVILINNGIHPGESDGIDATMMLFRDLAFNKTEAPKNTV
ncbi:MAG: hypothetical protein ACPGVB_16725, partial [Chitinophagales bacterium]